eukprot:GFKZ01004150.1.p1 GENE.GFKZ01004150.1~~GFKZ01004150.1.p1  ORF type:complete len:221 (+),score=23.63 GFKZ01004150.1:111-773(+)
MWRISNPTAVAAELPAPLSKQREMVAAPTLPPPASNSAQDLELVSALMSMRRSAPKYQLPSLRHRLPGDDLTFGSESPTRIDEPADPPPAVPVGALHSAPQQSILSTHKLPPLFTQAVEHRQLQPLSRGVGPIHHPLNTRHKPLTNSAPSLAGPANIRYTPEQRREAVRRFKAKKLRRKNQSTAIRYQIRKRLADTRPRFRGRFSKPSASGGEKSSAQDK